MTPYEMMLSESQERMLMVLRPEKEAEARAVFEKWELDFATVGKTTDDLRFRVLWQGTEVANLPIKELGDEAPEYDRPRAEFKKPRPLGKVPSDYDVANAVFTLVSNANGASRRWVWEQYDHLIQSNTLQIPGGDAGVVRVEGHDTKALAFSVDVTPRYCEADAREGGKQAVAECWRNLTAVGAVPLASTDNLNFGNPEKPEIMGQFAEAIMGIGEACRELDFPIVSGNVSLYNETNGIGILPTPAIGGVGLIADWSKMAKIGFEEEGQAIVLIGAPSQWGSHLGQSSWLRDVVGRIEGSPPPVDLEHERKAGEFVRNLIEQGITRSVHDCSDGGLAVALAEMAIASGIGAQVNQLNDVSPIETFFGEDQGRYVVALDPRNLDVVWEKAARREVSAFWIGNTGGDSLILGEARAISVEALIQAHESWFPDYMDDEPSAAATA